MARRRSAWRTRLIADGVRAPVQPRGVLAKFEDLCAAVGRRQATETGPTDATVDGSRVPRKRAHAVSHTCELGLSGRSSASLQVPHRTAGAAARCASAGTCPTDACGRPARGVASARREAQPRHCTAALGRRCALRPAYSTIEGALTARHVAHVLPCAHRQLGRHDTAHEIGNIGSALAYSARVGAIGEAFVAA